MVYQGKPSAGCTMCRQRKIKCDELRPACSQCVNTKRQCPGYVPRFDLVLRDQTEAVHRRANKSRARTSLNKSPTTSVSSGRGSPSGVVQKSPPDEPIPKIFNDFTEQEAICAFFLDFVLLPRHKDSVQGHLEHLLPLYANTAPDSPLSLATSAVALVLSGGSPTKRIDKERARQNFSKAIRRTRDAIRSLAESKKDETLMAVLVLGLYEKIIACPGASRTHMARMHNAGAAALVMHRGPENVKTPLGIGLLFSVRSQLVELAIEECTSFKRCPDTLTELFRSLPQNAAARLTSATINIADLRASAKSALLLPRTPESEQEVNDLLEYAISVDLLIGAWADTLPEEWNWTPADGLDYPLGDALKSTYVYGDRMDVYIDLWVQSIWNQYRSARIKSQTIILDCISWLGTPYEHQWYWRAIYARMVSQEMVDDICATVPFALGTKTTGGPGDRDGVEFPYAGGQKMSEEHRRAASALGGWHLLEPMRTALRPNCLGEGQKEWIVSQMQRITRIYALQSYQGVGELVDQQMYDQQLYQRYEFDCPS